MPMAVEVLKGLPRFDRSDAVFTYGGKAPTTSLSRAKRALDAAMRVELGELKPFVLHDVRRTVASGLAGLGVQPHIIEAVLNHRSGTVSGIAAVYNKYSYTSEKAVALQRWAEHIERITSGAEVSNIVEMAMAATKRLA